MQAGLAGAGSRRVSGHARGTCDDQQRGYAQRAPYGYCYTNVNGRATWEQALAEAAPFREMYQLVVKRIWATERSRIAP